MPPAICTCPGGLNIFFLYKSAASRQQLFSLTPLCIKKAVKAWNIFHSITKMQQSFCPEKERKKTPAVKEIFQPDRYTKNTSRRLPAPAHFMSSFVGISLHGVLQSETGLVLKSNPS